MIIGIITDILKHRQDARCFVLMGVTGHMLLMTSVIDSTHHVLLACASTPRFRKTICYRRVEIQTDKANAPAT